MWMIAVAGTALAGEGPNLQGSGLPEWSANSDGVIELHVSVPEGYSWKLSARASMGTLRTMWTAEAVPTEGELVVRLEPPAEAWLDDLAADYLTDLAVRLSAYDANGLLAFQLAAPPAFLTWPSGKGTDAVVWDAVTADRLAPRGIASALLRATIPGDSTTRVVPPISRGGDPVGDETDTDADRDQFDGVLSASGGE